VTDLQSYLLRTLERAFSIIALMVLAGAMTPFLLGFLIESETMNRDLAGEVESGNITFQAVTLTIYSVGLLWLLAERARLPALLAGNWPMLALTVLALLSALWSYYPEATARRAVALTLTTTFAFYLVLRYTPRDLLHLVALALLLGAALSLALVILWPDASIHHVGDLAGNWIGTFGHKNRLGRMMALGVVVFRLLLMETGGKTRPVNWVGLVLCGFMLVMSQSRTALVVTAVLLGLIPALRFLRGARLPLSLRVGSLMILGFLVVMAGTHFLITGLEALGRDMTFSGRTTIWTYAVAAGMEHSLLGAGYRAFWTPEGASYVYARIWGVVGNGHNGYLDIWLELGFAGIGLFLVMYLTSLKRAYARLNGSSDIVGLFYALILVYGMVYSFTEKFLLEQSELTWVLILATLLYLTPRRQALQHTGVNRLVKLAGEEGR
jgi:exopolysaccharide production protein ExoQ